MMLVVKGLAIPGCLYVDLVLDLELVVLHSRKYIKYDIVICICTVHTINVQAAVFFK